ncbi:Mevalonate kinase [Saitoella coloradoensis]
MSESFFVSAPGKVILFGEHSVVHGKAAIAAAVSLRSYLLVSSTPATGAPKVTLNFADVHLQHSWDIASLPWSSVTSKDPLTVPHNLEPVLTAALEPHLAEFVTSPFKHAAAYAFLYLFLHLASPSTSLDIIYTLRSTLPIGAGLGSSASISVAISAGLLLQNTHITPPTPRKDRGTELKLIDAWSFIGEKCIHGTPSGVDNAVASSGGAVVFQRSLASPTTPPAITKITTFPALPLLLTNTRVPRRTAELVAGVGRLTCALPGVAGPIHEAIHGISEKATTLLLSPPSQQEFVEELSQLVRINHGLLDALGVSHPALENVRRLSSKLGVGETKLTGAGGGGCAITLLKHDVQEQKLRELEERLREEGYEMYEVTLGGSGVGVLRESGVEEAEFLGAEGREGVEDLVGRGRAWEFWTQ